jgi:hypothetical protein
LNRFGRDACTVLDLAVNFGSGRGLLAINGRKMTTVFAGNLAKHDLPALKSDGRCGFHRTGHQTTTSD